jgi:NitT/TauT family transport system permease protein
MILSRTGIFLAFLVGIILAIITVSLPFLNDLVSPVMSTVKATPVASFIFIAIIFMKRNFLPVFITALLVLPIVWTNVAAGIKSVSKELKDVSKVYCFSFNKKITKLYIPCIMPYFLASCRSSLGMAWKAGVAAEVLCIPTVAIGTELYFAKTYLDTQKLFAWTVITIILSLIIEKLIIYIISKLSGNYKRAVNQGDTV